MFVFCFDGEKENRMYFKDGILFRWIDEANVIHDNEWNNSNVINLRNQTLAILDSVK